MGDSADATRVRVEKKIDSFVEGDLEHATEMFSALWKIANKDGNITAPSNSSPAVSSLFACILPSATWGAHPHYQAVQVTSPAHWPSVKTALIKSIRTGAFFDRKYWARHLKTGDVLKPVYFSSTIMDDKSHQLNKRKSKFICKFVTVLMVASGKIHEGEKYFRLRPRWRRQC